jgi:hypothetical protein
MKSDNSAKSMFPLRLLASLVVISASLALGWYLSKSGSTGFRDVQIAPGTEILAMDNSLVIQLSYESPAVRLLADRSDARAKRFRIHVEFKGGGVPQDCIGGDGFEEVLKHLTSLKALKSYGSGETPRILAAYPVDLGGLTLRDSMTIESQRWIFRGVGSSRNVICSDGVQVFELALSSAVFDKLNGGCPALQY